MPARFAVLDDRDQTEMMERANLGGAAGGLARSRQRDRPRAADRDGERRRRHLQGRGARGLPQPRSFHGLDRSRRQRRGRGARRCRPRSASIPTTASRTSSARSSMDRICRDRAGRRSPRVLDAGSKTDQDQAARLRERAGVHRRGAGRRISRRVPHRDRAQPRKSVVTKKFADNNPAVGRLFEAKPRASAPDRTAPRGRPRATAPRRCCTSRPRPRQITAREKQERGLLDYDDLIDKTLAMLDRVVVRLGALQARPRRRSRADRRGAGHQPAAMGHRRAHHRRIHLRRRRARRRQAHRLRGRRREAVDLLVPGRGAARIRPRRRTLQTQVRGCRAEVRSGVRSPIRSAPGRRSCNRSTTCSATQEIYRSIHAVENGYPAARGAGRRRPEPDRSLGTGRRRRQAGHRRLARAVRRRVARPARR